MEKIKVFSETWNHDMARSDIALIKLEEAISSWQKCDGKMKIRQRRRRLCEERKIEEMTILRKWQGKMQIRQGRKRKFQKRLCKERKTGEIRIQMKIKRKNKERKKVCDESVNFKLPKQLISNFMGTALEQFCIWNQFETEVNKWDIGTVTKF